MSGSIDVIAKPRRIPVFAIRQNKSSQCIKLKMLKKEHVTVLNKCRLLHYSHLLTAKQFSFITRQRLHNYFKRNNAGQKGGCLNNPAFKVLSFRLVRMANIIIRTAIL